MDNTNDEKKNSFNDFQILYSTQTGHSKACARHCARILKQSIPKQQNKKLKIHPIQTFDEYTITNLKNLNPSTFLICFISTTGEGEHTDTIQNVWSFMLQKNHTKTLFQHINFVVFSLGDRNYGPDLFCAAGRKFTVRMMQLGGRLLEYEGKTTLGYGDEDGDTLQDLDHWLDEILLPSFNRVRNDDVGNTNDLLKAMIDDVPFDVTFTTAKEDDDWYIEYLMRQQQKEIYKGCVTSNIRLTSSDWHQNVSHISIDVPNTYNNGNYYKAGDVAIIYPKNPSQSVDKFISLLSPKLQLQINDILRIHAKSQRIYHPNNCTFKSYLTYCAGIHSPPEREDLYLLSYYCCNTKSNDDETKDQKEKLQYMSSAQGSALYVDYIIRQRRNWIDVLYDFDTIYFENLKDIIQVLPLIQPRYFSIASSPLNNILHLELCVAKIEQKTSLGRCFQGLCSSYLVELQKGDNVYFSIKKGSFQSLPCQFSTMNACFEKPLLCIGAGTGIAPLRGIIQYREQLRINYMKQNQSDVQNTNIDTILLFGCRRSENDFIYQSEWDGTLKNNPHFKLFTAFSQDNLDQTKVKTYVQHILQKNIKDILLPIIKQQGAIYVAGNVKMCQAIKEITQEYVLTLMDGDEKKAKKILKRWKNLGLFCIEAW